MTPKPLPPLAEEIGKILAIVGNPKTDYFKGVQSGLLEAAGISDPYDAELARLRAENLKLRASLAEMLACADDPECDHFNEHGHSGLTFGPSDRGLAAKLGARDLLDRIQEAAT